MNCQAGNQEKNVFFTLFSFLPLIQEEFFRMIEPFSGAFCAVRRGAAGGENLLRGKTWDIFALAFEKVAQR